MKPFEKGDRVKLIEGHSSIALKDKIFTVRQCGLLNGVWYIALVGMDSLQPCRIFTKSNNRKERISKLYEE